MKTSDSHSLSPRASLQPKGNPADPFKSIEIGSHAKLVVQVQTKSAEEEEMISSSYVTSQPAH